MIDPGQIKKKAIARYSAFLRSVMANEPFFPLSTPVGKRPSDFIALKKAVNQLQNKSKESTGFGYTLELETKRTYAHHNQSLPTRIYFANEPDYLKFIQKEAEVLKFRQDVALIRATVPALEDWLHQNAPKVVDFAEHWSDLLKVCEYFQQQPQPNRYLRELPIAVHTKFVEQHKKILRSLLESILPDEQLIDVTGERGNIFEKRFSLKYAEPTIRLRFLDVSLQTKYDFPVADMSIPLSSFEQLGIRGTRCFITENQMNFLTLPTLPNSFALFGSGYAVQALQSVGWLRDCNIFYWGDLDAQGFQIPSHLRSHFPKVRSIMMDENTLKAFDQFTVTDVKAMFKTLSNLTEEEQAVYKYLVTNKVRLEQEHILQNYVNRALNSLG
ncbi:MAG: Wadjet anti-phage system protein JetD domain-containing protein [Cyanobacteria bacterium P01_D01_bin.36]